MRYPGPFTTEESTTMNSTERAERRIRAAEEELRLAREELERARAYPEEPDVPFITFTVQHTARGRYYDYAAIQTGGRWYITGSRCPKNGYSWRELIDWLREAFAVSGIHPLTPDPEGNSVKVDR